MTRALFHAARGQGRTTPNPMVGAVIVTPDGVVIGQGYHARAGEPHAEVHALQQAGPRARGATMYVSLEPCCHVGRTGPCTRAIIDAGITRVVAAMRDPDPRVSGQGFAELRASGVRLDVGVCEAEASRLNQAFVMTMTHGRPLVVLKAATSLDARVAARPGERSTITGREANRKSQRLRATIDAIAVGSQTVLVDDPLLTARGCYRDRPLLRVVFDRRLRTPTTSRLLSTLHDGPIVIVTDNARASEGRAAALTRAGAQVLEAPTIAASLKKLTEWNVSTLLVEGGPALHRAFADAGVVDRVHLVIAPQAIGESGIRWLDVHTLPLPYGAGLAVEPRGNDTWIEADVHWHR